LAISTDHVAVAPQLAGSINGNSTASKVKIDEGDRLVHKEKIMIVLKK